MRQQIYSYFGRFRASSGRLGALPPWARAVLGLAALPGLVLLVLSIAAVLVSILALLLLTLPVYRLLSAATSAGGAAAVASPEMRQEPNFDVAPGGRRHVDVKVIEPQEP
jgi:hypothetical protein